MSLPQDDTRSQGYSATMGNNDHFLDSTESTLVLLYNFKEQKYQFLETDKQRLEQYYSPKLFEKKVLDEIIKDPRRMPFTQHISFHFQALIKAIKYLIFLAFLVACFYLLVYCLLNPIVFAIELGAAIWCFISLQAFQEKIYFWVRNKPLNNFISKINQQEDILVSGILVVAGQEGKWIEIELQEREDDFQQQFDDPDIYQSEDPRSSSYQVSSQFNKPSSLRVAQFKRPLGRSEHTRQSSYKIQMGETPKSSLQRQLAGNPSENQN